MPRKPPHETEADGLRKEIARLRAQVDELQAELVKRAVAEVRYPPPRPLLQQVAAAVARLEPEAPDGLVPLPALRRAVPAPREELDEALLELERRGQIALVAIRNRELVCGCGLSDPERGLLYYARPQPGQSWPLL